MIKYIQREECKDDCLYLIMARHARIGISTDNGNIFIICRDVFGSGYLAHEYHWDFDPRKGTVMPYRCVEITPVFNDDNMMIDYLRNKNMELSQEIMEMEKENLK